MYQHCKITKPLPESLLENLNAGGDAFHIIPTKKNDTTLMAVQITRFTKSYNIVTILKSVHGNPIGIKMGELTPYEMSQMLIALIDYKVPVEITFYTTDEDEFEAVKKYGAQTLKARKTTPTKKPTARKPAARKPTRK